MARTTPQNFKLSRRLLVVLVTFVFIFLGVKYYAVLSEIHYKGSAVISGCGFWRNMPFDEFGVYSMQHYDAALCGTVAVPRQFDSLQQAHMALIKSFIFDYLFSLFLFVVLISFIRFLMKLSMKEGSNIV